MYFSLGSLHFPSQQELPKLELKFPTVKFTQNSYQFTSVQFSRSVVSDSLQPQEWQHARPPCPSQTPGVCSNSCLLSQWCYLTISSSAAPFSYCLQSFPASVSFPMSRLFASGGQSIRTSASACPSNEYSGLSSFRINWFDPLAVQVTLKSLL